NGLPFANADELRICPKTRDAEDLVADSELGDLRADGLDLPCELHAENPLPGAEQSGEGPDEERRCAPQAAIRSRNARRVHGHQNVVLARNRPFDVFESQHLGRPVSIVNHRSHCEDNLPGHSATACWTTRDDDLTASRGAEPRDPEPTEANSGRPSSSSRC